MQKKSFILALFVLAGSMTMQANANSVGVQDLQDLPKDNQVQTAQQQAQLLNSDSYAFKTLQSLTTKYGLLVDIPKNRFDGKSPLTRNEAALILVNLIGKIDKDKVHLNEVDKERIDILNDELKQEVSLLTARVAKVETSVDALQGSVTALQGKISDIEDEQMQHPTFNFGKSLKIGGMVRGEFSSTSQQNVSSNFSMPLGIITLSGQPMDHVNYFMMLDPMYGNLLDNKMQDPSMILDRGYIQTDIIPYHKLTLGKQVVPSTEIANLYYSQYETTDFLPQIALNTENRQAGIKLAGDFKYLKYSAGIYSRNVVNSGNSGLSYGFNGGVKPFAGLPKLGNLELGGAYFVSGKQTSFATTCSVPSEYLSDVTDKSTSLYSFYGKYKYKKFQLMSEVLHQTNQLALAGFAPDPFSPLNPLLWNLLPATVAQYGDVTGWYIQPMYDITPKLAAVARFDTMKNSANDLGFGNEYLAGLNYYLKYPNLKLMTDYLHQEFDGMKPANKVMIQTQLLF